MPDLSPHLSLVLEASTAATGATVARERNRGRQDCYGHRARWGPETGPNPITTSLLDRERGPLALWHRQQLDDLLLVLFQDQQLGSHSLDHHFHLVDVPVGNG